MPSTSALATRIFVRVSLSTLTHDHYFQHACLAGVPVCLAPVVVAEGSVNSVCLLTSAELAASVRLRPNQAYSNLRTSVCLGCGLRTNQKRE